MKRKDGQDASVGATRRGVEDTHISPMDDSDIGTAAPAQNKSFPIDLSEAFKHVIFAVIAGVACGVASVILCLCIGWAYDLFTSFQWLVWVLPIMGILQLVLYRFFRLPADVTTHRVVEQMRKDERISPLLAPGILLGTCLTIVSGGSVGKEAGALQMGASIGSIISRPMKLRSVFKASRDESMNGFAASVGMAAEFSALFFAPLGSAVFVVELSRFKPSINRHLATILIACFVAFFISNATGIGDVIQKTSIPHFGWMAVAVCVVVGVSAAFMGSIFDCAIHVLHDITWRISHNLNIWVIVGGLLFAGLVTLFGWQGFTGTGGDTLNAALSGTFSLPGFAIKALLTLICLGFWFKGGEIMPSFCIGGLLGGTCATLMGFDASFGAAIGVICFFAAFSRCPMGAFLMGCEIFGWNAAVYLFIGIFVAYCFSYPIGMYGDGLDRVVRIKWHRRFRNLISARIHESDAVHAGIIAKSEGVVRSMKDTIDVAENSELENAEARRPSAVQKAGVYESTERDRDIDENGKDRS